MTDYAHLFNKKAPVKKETLAESIFAGILFLIVIALVASFFLMFPHSIQ